MIKATDVILKIEPITISGISIHEALKLDMDILPRFYFEKSAIEEASSKLENIGLKTLYKGSGGLSVVAPAKKIKHVLGVKLRERIVDLHGRKKIRSPIKFFEFEDTDNPFYLRPPSNLENSISSISLPVPPTVFLSSLPPPVKYYHLNVPSDVELGINASKVHRMGITGKGVTIAMVDTGFYKHPFYLERGYQVRKTVLGPIAANPDDDASGHGTGEAANIFATAPDITLIPVKAVDDTNLKNRRADFDSAFKTAIDLNPDIISCSWGHDLRMNYPGYIPCDRPPLKSLPPHLKDLEGFIEEAKSKGIIVCFSAGNGQIGFPGMHPDVISVGGAYLDNNMNLEASDYASGFESRIYKNRNVPDICGLVGKLPKARYIMLPVPPGCDIDIDSSGESFPEKDETSPKDGWAVFSGTSAACPQVAGVCALLLEAAKEKLTLDEVKDILTTTATDVKTGHSNRCADGSKQAKAGFDLATGHGLVNAYEVIKKIKH